MAKTCVQNVLPFIISLHISCTKFFIPNDDLWKYPSPHHLRLFGSFVFGANNDGKQCDR